MIRALAIWPCKTLLFLVVLVQERSVNGILEFNGRSFSPPKFVEKGNWIPSSLLTFSEHWISNSDADDTFQSGSDSSETINFQSSAPKGALVSRTDAPSNPSEGEIETATWYVEIDNLKNHRFETSNLEPPQDSSTVYAQITENPSLPQNVLYNNSMMSQYIPDEYGELREELKGYYFVPSDALKSSPVGASLLFDNPQKMLLEKPNVYNYEYYQNFGTKEEMPNTPKRKNIPHYHDPIVDPDGYQNSGYKPYPQQLPIYIRHRKPVKSVSFYKKPKKPVFNRMMDFLNGFQDRKASNHHKVKEIQSPNYENSVGFHREAINTQNQYTGSDTPYEQYGARQPNIPTQLKDKQSTLQSYFDQSSSSFGQIRYRDPTKQVKNTQKPSSLVDRMVESVHTYFQRGYAAKKRKPYENQKIADGGISTAPIGGLGLAAAIASVIWYGISKGTTPVVTARTEGRLADTDLLFRNIDNLENILDDEKFIEKYSNNSSTFADMVKELVVYLAKKEQKK